MDIVHPRPADPARGPAVLMRRLPALAQPARPARPPSDPPPSAVPAGTGAAPRAPDAPRAPAHPLLSGLAALLVLLAATVVGAVLVAEAAPWRSPPTLPPGVVAVVAASTGPSAVDWPARFRDQPLTPRALAPVERDCSRDLAGTVAAFDDGDAALLVRQVGTSTRTLRPLASCYRAAGWQVQALPDVLDSDGGWRCDAATRAGRALQVCERIHDGDGNAWRDAAVWFWESQYGGGPWWSVARVRPLPTVAVPLA